MLGTLPNTASSSKIFDDWLCTFSALIQRTEIQDLNKLNLLVTYSSLDIYKYIIIMLCHQHGSSWPYPATLLYHPSLPVGLQGYILYRHSCYNKVLAGCLVFARPCEGVHRSTSLMSSPLLLQQCPACLVHLTLIVIVMGGKWPYSCCFVGCDSAINWLWELFIKPANKIFARHVLSTHTQKEEETIDEYIQELLLLAKECNFQAVDAVWNWDNSVWIAFITGLSGNDYYKIEASI